MDPSSYVPLVTAEQDADVVLNTPRRSKCRNVIIYLAVTVALLLSFAGAIYFLFPHQRSSSSNTVTIVNRYPDEISVYEVTRDGDEKILAHLGPNDRIRLFPEKDNQCFVRHLESYINLEQVNFKGATIVVGDGLDDVVPSRSGGQEQMVTFINDEAEPVTISWIDFDGVSVEMSQLGPNEQFDMKTYVDHVFAISSAQNHQVIGQFTIRPDVPVIRTQPVIEPKDHAIRVAVENLTSGTVKLMWRDADGADHVVGELEPNTKSVMDSFVGHELYFMDSDGALTESTIIVPSITLLRATENSTN